MKTDEIKTWLKKNFGLKKVRVRSSLTKIPYFIAWIPSENTPHKTGVPPIYTEEFPLTFRQICLRVIYGENCGFAGGGCAGYVRHHDIAMYEKEWDIAIERMNIKLAAQVAGEKAIEIINEK